MNGKYQRNKHEKLNILFFNDMVNIKSFNQNLLKIDKKSQKHIHIYYIGYITIREIGDYECIHSINSLYLIIEEVGRYIDCNSMEESNGNKYLIFASTDKNKEELKTYTELWDEIKNLIEKINDKPGEY